MKTIRIIVLLAIIAFSAINTLDMSSAKTKASSSAYVAMYTELGFSTGFKNMEGLSSTRNRGRGRTPEKTELANFWLRYNDGKKDIDIGSKNLLSTSTFIVYGSEEIMFDIRADWPLPKFLEKYCSSLSTSKKSCSFSKTMAFILGMDEANFFLQVSIDKNHTFQIMIANGSEDKMDNSICRATLEAMVEEHKKYIYQRNEEFYRIISEIISRLETTLRTFGQMKKIVAENKQYLENRIKEDEEKLKKLNSIKKRIAEEIKNLHTVINNKKNEVKLNIKKNANCQEEIVSINLAIFEEEKKKEKEEAKFAKNLKESKERRQKHLKTLFYWLEASYFYRVFAEKLVKDVAALDVATTDATIKGTQEKVIKAFKPITVLFASVSSK